MTEQNKWEDPIDWEEFRAVYAADSPGLSKIADAFESAGLEFLSYGDLRFKGKQIGILRVSLGLSRYAIFGTEGSPVGLARLQSGRMITLPIPASRRDESVWDAVVHAIRRSVKLN